MEYNLKCLFYKVSRRSIIIHRMARKNKTVNLKGDNNEEGHDWTIYHLNIRGLSSKQESLNSILKMVNPNVINLNEESCSG